MSRFHVAQANIARVIAPLDDPAMSGFVNGLERINALADRSPGFVWRYQTDAGDATGVRAFGDDIIFNMSVWENIEALHAFVYSSEHVRFLRARRQWFQRAERPTSVLWWIPATSLPTIEDARKRLEWLEHHGPIAAAFTFADRFSAEDHADRMASARSVGRGNS